MSNIEVEVDVEYLDSDAIDEHLRSSTKVLQEILQSDPLTSDSVGSAGGDHACTKCGKLYKTASTLHTHCLLKHPSESIEVRCTACDKTYASLLSLQKHVRYMHRFQHRCKACYRTFETPIQLDNHATVCARFERPCPTCGQIYDSSLSLRNHIKYKHPEERTNWCEICRRAFNSARSLANHFAAIHPDGTSCIKCDRKFNSVIALQSHYLYKHAEHSLKCKMCRKVFASKRNLSRHLTKNHNIVICQDGNYICGICNASFHSSPALVEHVMDLHTGPKPDGFEH